MVLREDIDGIAVITLNRPEKKNAINRVMFRQFRRHMKDIAASDAIGAVIIKGAGDGFCAGHDLFDPDTKNDEFGWLRIEVLSLEKITRMRQPVIAQVHGWCFTGGLELALTADFIIAGDSARFGDTHAKWGIVPGWGMSQRLPRRVGQAKALEMMFTCRHYSGEEALAMGLANHCVPDAELDDTVMAMAREIVGNSWHSHAANKKLVYETDAMPLSQGLTHEIMRNEGFDPKAAERKEAFARRKA